MLRPLSFFLAFSVATAAASTGTVLVVPFFNVSSSSNLDWISESIAQTMREALAARGILVVSREDRQEVYRRLSIRPNARLTRASVIKVAEALDAAEVIYGNMEFVPAANSTPKPEASPGPGQPAPLETRPVLVSRGTLRLTASLLDTKHMRKGPDFVEEGPLEDLAKLQTQLAWQVLRFLAPEATPPAEQFLQEHPPVRLDAMENYIRGLLAASPEQKHRYFTQAVRLDARFSQPCFELGRLYWEKKEYRLAAGWLARVKPSDPHHLEANFFLGICRYYSSDFDRARAAFELVAQSVPLNEVFNNLAAAQSRRNLPEALENFRKALEGDPSDPDYHFNVGYILWKRKDFAAAAERFRAVLERNAEDEQATLLLGRCLQKNGPRPGDSRTEGLERLKHNFEERAYRELKAQLEAGKKE